MHTCMYVCTCKPCMYVQSLTLGVCSEGIHNAGIGVLESLREKGQELGISTL